jgi:hypothetical protein
MQHPPIAQARQSHLPTERAGMVDQNGDGRALIKCTTKVLFLLRTERIGRSDHQVALHTRHNGGARCTLLSLSTIGVFLLWCPLWC